MLPELRADALTVFVFGPGTGEFVAVRSPPDHWLLMDGCSAMGVTYGRRFVEHYQIHPSVIVLTHPHLDHARGLEDVIDDATIGPKEKWPLLGMVTPPLSSGAGDLSDPQAMYAGGVAEQVVGAILDRWERNPSCRWDLRRGDSHLLGDSRLLALAPSAAARRDAEDAKRDARHFDPNIVSTALLVEWEGRRIVLGGDLVETPGGGWSTTVAYRPKIAVHHALKVPHHGSRNAQHDSLLAPLGRPGTPAWIVTPFASKNLPRFADNEGADLLLRHNSPLYATGLPCKASAQGVAPGRVKRSDLNSTDSFRRSPNIAGFPECFVAVSFPPDGTPANVVCGQGSIVIDP